MPASTPLGDQLWNQDSSGVLETSEAGDAFAADVWVGNYGFDDHADVVSNSVYEDLTTKIDTGGVNVIYGTPGWPLLDGEPVVDAERADDPRCG